MLYGVEMRPETINAITDEVYSELSAWQNREVRNNITIVLDGNLLYSAGKKTCKKRVIYSVYGINCEGQRDVIGIYIRNVEAASEWASIPTISLTWCVYTRRVDGLAGFKEAIDDVR